jgi:hypothetical protein
MIGDANIRSKQKQDTTNDIACSVKQKDKDNKKVQTQEDFKFHFLPSYSHPVF